MRVALYARYSNDRQNERSIEDQFAVCHVFQPSCLRVRGGVRG